MLGVSFPPVISGLGRGKMRPLTAGGEKAEFSLPGLSRLPSISTVDPRVTPGSKDDTRLFSFRPFSLLSWGGGVRRL